MYENFHSIISTYKTLQLIFIPLRCQQNLDIIVLFVETPRKFITAKLSIRKPGSSSVLIICDLFNSHALKQVTYECYICYKLHMFCELNKSHIISTDEDPGLRIESFAAINLRGVSTNNYYMFYRHANIQRT
jgi:hypothetical protein